MSHHVSPSQIATFGPLDGTGCRRQWWYSRRRPRRTNKWASFGTEVHGQLEQWLLAGEPPNTATPEGRCAMAAVPLLPISGYQVEREVREQIDGIEYLFRIDLLFGHEPGKHVVVWDHKTTGRLENAKTPEDLALDPQWITYGHWAAQTFDVPTVIGVWGYLQRNPPKAKPVAICESAESLAEKFDRQRQECVEPLLASWDLEEPDVPRNFEECYRYGTRNPCDFIEECHRDVPLWDVAAERLKGQTKQ